MQSKEPDVFDPLTPINLQEPFPFFANLREKSPVYWNEQYSFWMLTRYRDVKGALQAPRRFSSETGVELAARAERLPASSRDDFEIGWRFWTTHLQALDPPRHTEHRNSIMNGFTTQVIEAMRPTMEQRVDRLLDKMERTETCDFVEQFAYPLPSLVIFDLLGVPSEDHAAIREASAAMVLFPKAVLESDVETIHNVARGVTRGKAILERLIAERRRKPRQDLISALVRENSETASLPDDDIVVLCSFLLSAGHETTANLLSGSLRHMLESRQFWEQLVEAQEIVPRAVEELLRFVSPVLWTSRVLTEDVELDGHVMRKGSRVQLGIGAANHDPSQFANPESLDFARENVHSLAFGYGPHFCLGAALARVEAQVALSGLIRRMPRIQLAAEHFEYEPLFFLRSLKSLPVRVGHLELSQRRKANRHRRLH